MSISKRAVLVGEASGRTDAAALPAGLPEVVLSFDVESHARIDAARGIAIGEQLRDACEGRVEPATRWILDLLAGRGLQATFFVLAEVALRRPGLVRAIRGAGHEVASHGWDHRRVLSMTPGEFREDVRRSKETLEQLTGEPVVGYRAPTFSITSRNPWAIDVLAELGFRYDSSIFPVRHDRYGVAGAPRSPFLARGERHTIVEFPPTTLLVAGTSLPVGGGGYFRLLPPRLLTRALEQMARIHRPPVAMLYFHPWEFDPTQPRLPLRGLRRFRTYVGIEGSRQRLIDLLSKGLNFVTAQSAERRLAGSSIPLPSFGLS